MPAPARRTVHPLRVAILVNGYPSIADFAREHDLPVSALTAVVNYRIAPYPKMRRVCCDALDVPEAELFPPAPIVIAPARAAS